MSERKSPTIRRQRSDLAADDNLRREAVVQELEAIAAGEATDVIQWDDMGRVTLTPSDQLSERAKRAVKKVKVTPNQFGNTIEVEMHDKLSALRLLAKHRGLLEPNSDNMRPSMIGINITGPKTSIVDVEGGDG